MSPEPGPSPSTRDDLNRATDGTFGITVDGERR